MDVKSCMSCSESGVNAAVVCINWEPKKLIYIGAQVLYTCVKKLVTRNQNNCTLLSLVNFLGYYAVNSIK